MLGGTGLHSAVASAPVGEDEGRFGEGPFLDPAEDGSGAAAAGAPAGAAGQERPHAPVGGDAVCKHHEAAAAWRKTGPETPEGKIRGEQASRGPERQQQGGVAPPRPGELVLVISGPEVDRVKVLQRVLDFLFCVV